MTKQAEDIPAADVDESRKQASLKVARFEQRFEPSYRLLACYAALPLVLTPELVNYLRSQFLKAKHVPWVAEADLLLSDLCYPVGYEQYAMDSATRNYLVSELKTRVGQETMQAVARLLIRYVQHLAKTDRYLTPHELQSQQWAAMVFIDDQRVRAVQEIAKAYQESVEEVEEAGAIGSTSQAKLLQLSRITQELAPQINQYGELLDYAKLIGQMLADPSAVSPEQFDRSYDVEGVSINLPQALRPDTKTPTDLQFSDIPKLEDFDYFTPLVSFENDRENDIGLTSEVKTVQVATITIARSTSDSISEAQAYSALEQNLANIKQRIIEDFEERDLDFQVNKHPEDIQVEGIDEIQISLSNTHTPDVEILNAEVEGTEEGVATFFLLVKISFVAEVGYFNHDDDIPKIHDGDVPHTTLEWTGQTVEGRVQVYLSFSEEDATDVEITGVELELESPVQLREPDRPIPVEIASSEELEPFEIQIKTVEKVEGEWVALSATSAAHCYIEPLSEGIDLEMVAIPAGEFQMGSPEDEPDRYGDESPQHFVTVPGFFMGRYPVTQAQWRVVAALPREARDLKPDPSHFKGDDRPVEQVSWDDAVEFCARLSRHTGREYRLPSEAEWEYACRAGTTTPFHFGEMITTEVANYNGSAYADGPEGESRRETTPVTEFGIANAFGLSDMHGNVYEWCLDHWHDNYEGAPTDGSAWLDDNDNNSRIYRGGSWYFYPRICRSAYRDHFTPVSTSTYLGFRVVVAPRGLH